MSDIDLLKEKLENVRRFVEIIENQDVSKIEIDILLEKLRDIYLTVLMSDKCRKPVVEPPKPAVDDVATMSTSVAQPLPSEEAEIVAEPVTPASPQPQPQKPLSMMFPEHESPQQADNQLDSKPEPSSPAPVDERVTKNVRTSDVPVQQSLFPPKPAANVHTIGEELGKNKSESLNDKLAHDKLTTDISAKLKPVDDLRNAITVGDRYMFIREIFERNFHEYDDAIDHLNKMMSLSAAEDFLFHTLGLNPDDSVVQQFLAIVKRKFANK